MRKEFRLEKGLNSKNKDVEVHAVNISIIIKPNEIRRAEVCLRCPPKIMSFSQLPFGTFYFVRALVLVRGTSNGDTSSTCLMH